MKFNVLMMQPREDCTKQQAAPLGPLAVLNTAIDSIGLWILLQLTGIAVDVNFLLSESQGARNKPRGSSKRERETWGPHFVRKWEVSVTWRSSGLFRLIVSGLFIKPELQAQKNAKKTREIVQNYPDEQLQENSQKKHLGCWGGGCFLVLRE